MTYASLLSAEIESIKHVYSSRELTDVCRKTWTECLFLLHDVDGAQKGQLVVCTAPRWDVVAAPLPNQTCCLSPMLGRLVGCFSPTANCCQHVFVHVTGGYFIQCNGTYRSWDRDEVNPEVQLRSNCRFRGSIRSFGWDPFFFYHVWVLTHLHADLQTVIRMPSRHDITSCVGTAKDGCYTC